MVFPSARLLAPFTLAATALAQFAPGHLVVVRVGDGTAPLTNASTATFLDEYTPAGTLVSTVPVTSPTTLFTNSGTATSEGFLTRSSDGVYLLLGGYAVAPGLTSVASSASTSAPRVIARVDLLGAVDATTQLGTAYSGGNLRSVASPDGVLFWTAGSNSGVQFTIYGTNAPVAINAGAPTNNRVIGIDQGQLYTSSASGTFQGVSTVGLGLPTVGGQVVTPLPGFPTATGPSAYDWFFADPNTLYVADDRSAGGGIQKWTQSGGVWTLQYTLNTTPAVGCRGLTGVVAGGTATLFATTNTNALVTVTDTGASATLTQVATAPLNTAFRGLRLLGWPGVVSVHGQGSPTTAGIPSLGTLGGLPVVGNLGFQLQTGNMLAGSIGGLLLGVGNPGAGVPLPGAPASALLYVFPALDTALVLADAQGQSTRGFVIPPNPVLAGVLVRLQLLALDPAMPDPLPVGTSPALRLLVGN